MNKMQNYLENGVKPNCPFYKYLILNTTKYEKEIVDILLDIVMEGEVVQKDGYSIIFYFDNIDIDFNNIIKTINDDFYTDACIYESGKVVFTDGSEFTKLFNIYKEAGFEKNIYVSSKDAMEWLVDHKQNEISELAPIFLNKLLKDENLLMLVNTMFDNNLNISETAKNTYMHRNTVNYKVEQIKEETSIDIRKFKDAIILYQFLKNI